MKRNQAKNEQILQNMCDNCHGHCNVIAHEFSGEMKREISRLNELHKVKEINSKLILIELDFNL